MIAAAAAATSSDTNDENNLSNNEKVHFINVKKIRKQIIKKIV